MKIPLIKPYITDSIKKRVCDVLDSGYLTEGPVTREFENKLKEYLGCGYLHTVTSATTGLEVALRALGVGPGDEVIVPDYTYPATASVISIVGGVSKVPNASLAASVIVIDRTSLLVTVIFTDPISVSLLTPLTLIAVISAAST